jgi:hypothetical protein
MMVLLSLLAGAPLVASSAWVQDRFAISFWVRWCSLPTPWPLQPTRLSETPTDESHTRTTQRAHASVQVDPIVPPSRFPAEYKRIADANFTVSLQQPAYPVCWWAPATCNMSAGVSAASDSARTPDSVVRADRWLRTPAVDAQVLLGGFGATTPDTVTQQIAAASAAGLASVPSICGGKCANLSGAWGFQIADEPGTSKFAELAPLVATAKAAGQLAFVNLLPN